MLKKNSTFFVLWISRLPRGLKIPSWTFFNSPFRVEFENIQVFIIWWNLDWDICKLLQGGQFNHKYFVYFLIKRLSSNEYYGAVLSAHKRSVAFLDTKEQLRESCHGTMSTFECSWVLPAAVLVSPVAHFSEIAKLELLKILTISVNSWSLVQQGLSIFPFVCMQN